MRDAHEHLFAAGHRIRQLVETDDLVAAGSGENHCAHVCSLGLDPARQPRWNAGRFRRLIAKVAQRCRGSSIPPVSDLPARADVVIIGGGAMGASTAFHLATGGVGDVVLLERETLASGSTSRSAGGARLQFADELNVRLSLRSLEEFERWDALIGEHVEFVPDIAFRQVGYLFLLDTPELVAAFRAALAVQHAHGVPSRELTPAEAAAIVPQLELDGVLAATFCPRDGHMSPEAVVQGYAAAAVARGARVLQGCPAIGIEQRGRPHHRRAHARAGRSRPTRSCAPPGPGPARSARWPASRSRCTASRGTCGSRPSPAGVRDDVPLTIDFSTSFYFHREGPGIVFGGREAALEDVAEHALRRLPLVVDLPIQSSWWGYYEVSPDHNAIVGESSAPGRFLYATGFSGHGFQQAPAVGEHLAQLIRGERPAFDLGALSLERFARGEQRAERFVV